MLPWPFFLLSLKILPGMGRAWHSTSEIRDSQTRNDAEEIRKLKVKTERSYLPTLGVFLNIGIVKVEVDVEVEVEG